MNNVPWCNGNTQNFGLCIPGSNPGGTTKRPGDFPETKKIETMIDEQGIERHTWPAERVQRLYRELDNFIADLTHQEYRQFENDFLGVKTILHERMYNQVGNTATK